jgi:hypothetical protein
MLPRISITWMLAACGGDAASDKGGQGDDSAAPDEIIETGGFALAASVVGPDGAPSPESGLCAAAVDLSGAAWGNPSPAILAEAPVSGDGDVLLEIASVPSGATLGIGILIEACGEEAVMPTLSPIPATAWAWAGGQRLWRRSGHRGLPRRHPGERTGVGPERLLGARPGRHRLLVRPGRGHLGGQRGHPG